MEFWKWMFFSVKKTFIYLKRNMQEEKMGTEKSSRLNILEKQPSPMELEPVIQTIDLGLRSRTWKK